MAFTTEPQEVEKTIVVKEKHRIYATCEEMRKSLIAGDGDFTNFKGGIEIQESQIDNLVPFYIYPKQEFDGEELPKPKFNEKYHIKQVGNRYFLMCCEKHATGYNIEVGLSDKEFRGLAKYFDVDNYYINCYTKSKIIEIIKEAQNVLQKQEES